MPGYRAHLMGGFTVYIGLLYTLQSLTPTPLTMFEWLGCALIGSLFPDVDTKSKGQLWFYRLFFIILIILALKERYFVAAIISILGILPMLFRHRGLFHRPLFLVSIPVVAMIIIKICAPASAQVFFFDAIFFLAGALSHIVMDRGIKALFRM